MELTLERARRLMDEHDGHLDLRGSSITSLSEGLLVGGCLYLYDTPLASLPGGLVAGGGIDLSGTSVGSIPGDLLVGGSLYLRGTSVRFLPEGLVVGGTLDLRDTPIASLPGGLVVGGHLDLRGTGVASLPEDLLVGGDIFLPGGDAPVRGAYGLGDGSYVPGRYIFVDGILTHVRSEEHLDGHTVYVGKIPGRNVVTDGKRHARCGRICDGIADLAFMAASERGPGQYEGLPLDTEMSVDEARTMYRVITGFRRSSAENFIPGLEEGGKDRYAIRELLDLTGGGRVHESFWRFFREWKPPMFGESRGRAASVPGPGNGGPRSGPRVKNLAAQEGLRSIARELGHRGYVVEAVEALQGAFTQYVVFYKSENEVFVVESSDTFEIDDELVCFPGTYFHVGCFEKGHGFRSGGSYYGPQFSVVGMEAGDVMENLDAVIDKISSRHESDTGIGSEFEKWKSNRRCARIAG